MSVAVNVIAASLNTTVWFALILNIYSFSPCEYSFIQFEGLVTLTELISDVSSVTFRVWVCSSTFTDVTFLSSTSMDLIFMLPKTSWTGS